MPPAQIRSGNSGVAFGEEAIEECCRRLERTFRDEPYYSSGRTWQDYAPAYRYAFRNYCIHGGLRFEDIEPELAGEWEFVREQSRLSWPEARQAMAAAWRHARSRTRRPGADAARNPQRR